MRFMPRAALALLLTLVLRAPAAAQNDPASPTVDPIGATIPADAIRDLPLGDNVYSILETTQPEVISDRFNSGGLNVGGDARAGGFLGSWSQTLFRVGDLDVSDPSGSGSSLLFPDLLFWQNVIVTTGLMPADLDTPGLAVTLQPPRAGSTWTRMFSASGSGGSLASDAPAGQPVPIARLDQFAHGGILASGPVSANASLVAGATLARGSSYQREQLASTTDVNVSAFSHVVVALAPGREWRALGWLQHAETPFENWQPFRSAAASTRSTAVHLQTTLAEEHAGGSAWRVFGGFTQRARANDGAPGSVTVERITNGPVPWVVDSAADTTARRLALGGRYAPAPGRHRLEFGADVNSASTKTTGAFAGTVSESVDVVPARTWSYATPQAESNRSTATVSGYASDVLSVTRSLTLDAALRAEVVHGSADGAATSITWFSLLPHAYLRWAVSSNRALVLGYRRSGNALTTSWLAFGDPAGPTATVAAAGAPAIIVSRVGPGTGGNPAFSRIDENLKRPYTDEVVIGWERRHGTATRYTLTGIARRETNMLAVVNTGVPATSYSTISIPDAGQDLLGPADDRILTVYNRLPASFGQDSYLLTNPDQKAATVYALRMSWEHTGTRLFMLFGATASAAEGSGGNRGYGPLENDQDVPGELFTNPNAQTYARGRLFSDRAFTIKWSTVYRFPGDFTIGGIARYQDGQPFSRMVIAPGLNQGAEAVQAYPNAGSRFTFTGTFDLRVQKGFTLGGTRLDAFVDAYNLFTRDNEVEEYVVTGPMFRSSTAIEPPHSVHLGLRVTF